MIATISQDKHDSHNQPRLPNDCIYYVSFMILRIYLHSTAQTLQYCVIFPGHGLGVHNTDLFTLALSVMLVLVCVFTIQIYLSCHFLLCLCWSGCSQQIYLSWHFLLCLCWSGCSQYRCIILALSVMLTLGRVFTIQIYSPWYFLLCLHWSGCSQ